MIIAKMLILIMKIIIKILKMKIKIKKMIKIGSFNISKMTRIYDVKLIYSAIGL